MNFGARIGHLARQPGRHGTVPCHRLFAERGDARVDAEQDELGVDVGGRGDDNPVDPGPQ